jgi:glycosyltransferase involved in cell wall biosynthesis
MRVAIVIPAYNEATALPKVLADLPRSWVQRIVVSDNGSTDGTPDVALACGAEVVREARHGYGWACWAGVNAVLHDCDVIAMLDAGGKEDAAELPLLLQPILEDKADFVLGSRVRYAAPGALTSPQKFGNWLTTQLMARLYGLRDGARVTDLAPFRAIRSPLLQKLHMQERTFGWPTEMIVKAARAGARIAEVDVHYRPRYAGKSKVSGTLKGSVKAGVVILRTAFKYVRWESHSA